MEKKTRSKTVDQFQQLLGGGIEYNSTIRDRHFYNSQGFSNSSDLLATFKRIGEGEPPPVEESVLIRSLLPSLRKDFLTIQKGDGNLTDFNYMAGMREALDTLKSEIREFDAKDHSETVHDKQESLKHVSIQEMECHKRNWLKKLEDFEAWCDARELLVLNKCAQRIQKLEQDSFMGLITQVGGKKRPKLNPKALELQAQLHKFSALKDNDPHSLRKAARIQKEYQQFQNAAWNDFDKYQQEVLQKMRDDIYKERDLELLKVRKRRVDGRQKIHRQLQTKSQVLGQKHSNYQRALQHDSVLGHQDRVMYGVTPKRPFPVISLDPHVVGPAPPKEMIPHPSQATKSKSKRPSTRLAKGGLPPIGPGLGHSFSQPLPPCQSDFKDGAPPDNSSEQLFSSTPFNSAFVAA